MNKRQRKKAWRKDVVHWKKASRKILRVLSKSVVEPYDPVKHAGIGKWESPIETKLVWDPIDDHY